MPEFFVCLESVQSKYASDERQVTGTISEHGDRPIICNWWDRDHPLEPYSVFPDPEEDELGYLILTSFFGGQ